jgi:hypothetical protein
MYRLILAPPAGIEPARCRLWAPDKPTGSVWVGISEAKTATSLSRPLVFASVKYLAVTVL